MMRFAVVLALFAVASGSVAVADAPTTSLRPVARPVAVIAVIDPPPVAAQAPDARQTQAEAQVERRGLLSSLRPLLRPEGARPRQGASQDSPPAATPRLRNVGGALCGVPDLQGEAIGTVVGAGQCGIKNAVKLRAVSGVRLSTPATIDCSTAKALKKWVDGSLLPQVGRRGGGVSDIRIAASYACRGRNNQKGARLSEHSFGHAVDISGLTLRDGTMITVLQGWGSGKDGKLLKRLHRDACGPFGTVLGPNSDRFHKDHFHFDTARYRSGPYCK